MEDVSGTTITPEDFEEFSRSSDENIMIGVTTGMELEARSRSFYQSVVNKLPPDRRIVLKFLANEELEHLKTLTAFKTALQKNGRWIELNQKQLRRVRVPRLYVGKGSAPVIDEGATDQEIMLEAMKAEKRSEEFYKRVMETVRDEKVQRLFGFLGRFERGHYDLLRKMLQT